MAQLFLIRHSMPAIEPLVAPRHWLLSAKGEAATKEFSQRIPPPPGPLYTSPEPKAVRTARLLADEWKTRVIPEPALHELQGRRWLSNSADYEVSVIRYLRGDAVNGWEALEAAQARVAAAIGFLAGTRQELVVVSHGIVLVLLIASLLRVEPDTLIPMWQTMRFPDLCIVDSRRKRVLRSFGRPVRQLT